VKYIFNDDSKVPLSERHAIKCKFEALFIGEHRDLYQALCPFKAVFMLGGKLVKVSTDDTGERVWPSFHNNMVVV
jgi:hypothetical protein